MERQTAINIITDIMGCALGSHPCCDRDCDFCAYRIDNKSAIREAFDIALDSLNNESEAEEHRTPKKVIKIMSTERIGIEHLCYDCPNCHWSVQFIGTPISYCIHCGQAIDWSEAE